MLILIVSKLVQLLRREITEDSNRQSLQINVYDYTTRVTLDLTGDGELSPPSPIYCPPSASSLQTAAFGHQFGSLDDKQDRLNEVIKHLE